MAKRRRESRDCVGCNVNGYVMHRGDTTGDCWSLALGGNKGDNWVRLGGTGRSWAELGDSVGPAELVVTSRVAASENRERTHRQSGSDTSGV